MVTDLKLVRLLQLVSPGLPIGMYSYSQGLERAVDDGWIKTDDEVREWIGGIIQSSLSRVDLPLLARLYDAWKLRDEEQINTWSRTLIACRETSELRAEDRQSGQALARLLHSLEMHEMSSWKRKPEATLATVFSYAAIAWGIPKHETLIGYLWSWLENQTLCAVKLIPLGQAAGQQLLAKLAETIPATINIALSYDDNDIGGSAFGMVLASSRHEMQYSRLFRS